jgi:hypothetical protein
MPMTETKWTEGMGSSTLADVGAALEARLPGRVRRDVSSAELTTYRCGGPLAVFVRAEPRTTSVVVAEVLRPRAHRCS